MISTATNKEKILQVNTNSPNRGQPNNHNKIYRVFIVDDDPMVLKMLHRYLKNFSEYECTSFSSGEKCLKALDQKPDIILLDFNLSEQNNSNQNMDGLDVLKELKIRIPETQVLMLSAQVEVQVAVDCLKKGAVNYIVKDAVMQVTVKEAMDAIIKSRALKEEIHLLSNTIKRDKLLIRGYGVLTVILCFVLYYFWSN